MENLNEPLKEKTVHANNSEHFVFLPNDLLSNKYVSGINGNRIFREAITSKNAGNKSFQDKEYDEAICHYSEAIDILEKMNKKSCAPELSVCYQNRSAVKAHKKNYVESISDASKAIELNEYNSMGYFRRAMSYYDQKKYYCALQDITQACILEKFKNQTYIDIVVDILGKINADPIQAQWEKAYDEMGAASLTCDECSKQQISIVKKCGIIDPISAPIPKNQAITGYIRAMKGLNELKLSEIMAGCEEEITSKGKYLAQSYILQAYMKVVVIALVSADSQEWLADIQHMNEIIADPAVPESIKFHAKLCRVNLYNRSGLFEKGIEELKPLEVEYRNNGLLQVIKCAAFFQLSFKSQYFYQELNKCCRMLPNVYELQFQKLYAESKHINDTVRSIALLTVGLNELSKRFPKELAPRILLVTMYTDIDRRKAQAILKKAKRDFPDRLDEMSSLDGLMNATHSSCVKYFKQSLKFHKDDPNALNGLLEYFGSTTYEYAKALEVSTKALYLFQQKDDFKEMFQHRIKLLKKINRQNFWDQL